MGEAAHRRKNIRPGAEDVGKRLALAALAKTYGKTDVVYSGPEFESMAVEGDKVAHPVAVRYAWANNPPTNLYNKAGLPAVPFRTDDWMGQTADAR